MSISVVTVRDYEGVPSTRELYTRGARYVINSSGDLEILGAGQPGGPLGYYPSGNWMSVFVDDVVRILVKGEQDTSIIGAAPGATDTAADTADFGDTADFADTADTATEFATAADVDAAVDLDADAGTDLVDADDLSTDIDLEPVSVVDEPDTPIYRKVADELAAASAGAEPVAQPAADAATEADFGSDFHTDFDPAESATPPPADSAKPSRGTIPAGMQPVKFGPRIIRPPKPKVVPDPRRHMMPVTFRSKPLRAGVAKPPPAATDNEPRADSDGDEA